MSFILTLEKISMSFRRQNSIASCKGLVPCAMSSWVMLRDAPPSPRSTRFVKTSATSLGCRKDPKLWVSQ